MQRLRESDEQHQLRASRTKFSLRRLTWLKPGRRLSSFPRLQKSLWPIKEWRLPCSCVRWVRHVPWNKYKDDVDADGDIPEDNFKDAQARGNSQEVRNDPAVVIRTREVAPRDFYIKKQDAEKHG